MKLIPKYGIDQLLFGMKQNDVIAIYGKPNKQFKDDDRNTIFLFNNLKLRLTFYADEDFRLGYIITSHPEITLNEKIALGRKVAIVKEELTNFKTWEQEDFDSVENHFNEDNWVILQTEFDEIIKIEIGAIINNKDEFDWKFGNK